MSLQSHSYRFKYLQVQQDLVIKQGNSPRPFLLSFILHSFSLLSFLLLITLLFISRSMDLWKICISSLCSIDKLSFPSISIFSSLFKFSISSSVSQIIKELCSSSSYSFQFHYLAFNGITKEAISSQNTSFIVRFFNNNLLQYIFFCDLFREYI